MKRFIIMAFVLANALIDAFAQELPDTTIINNADSVLVVSGNKKMSVEVFGKRNDPDYHFSKTMVESTHRLNDVVATKKILVENGREKCMSTDSTRYASF